MVHRYSEARRPLSELWRLIWPDVVISMVDVSVHDPMVSRLPTTTVIDVEAPLDQARAGEMQVEYLASRVTGTLGTPTRPLPMSARWLMNGSTGSAERYPRRIGPEACWARSDWRQPDEED